MRTSEKREGVEETGDKRPEQEKVDIDLHKEKQKVDRAA